MMNRIKIKLDMPLDVREEYIGREHNQNFIATQIKEHLVYEVNPFNIENGLLQPGVKTESNKWIYHFLPRINNLGRQQETMAAIVHHLLLKVKSKDNAWITKIIKKISVKDDYIIIDTRVETNFLDIILNEPSLNIEKINNIALGDYVVSKESDFYVFHKNKPNIKYDFVVVGEVENRCDVDIHWGIGTPSSYFEEDDSLFSKEELLPLFYFLKAGRNLDDEVWNGIIDFISKSEIKNLAIIPTSSRVFDGLVANSIKMRENKQLSKCKKINLYHSKYAPNEEIANELSRITGGVLVPTVIDYYDMVMNSEKIQDGVVLNIKSPKHSGLIGIFPELYFLSSSNLDDSGKFQNLFNFCLKNKVDEINEEDALYLEDEINIACRQHVLGRLRPRFRTNLYIPITDSGNIKLGFVK